MKGATLIMNKLIHVKRYIFDFSSVNFAQYSYSMFAYCMHLIKNYQGTIDCFFVLLFLVA